VLASLRDVLQHYTTVPLQLIPTVDVDSYQAPSSGCVEKPSAVIRFPQDVLADRLKYLT
jgi:hypothetical protein